MKIKNIIAVLVCSIAGMPLGLRAVTITGNIIDQGSVVSGMNLQLHQAQHADVQLYYEGQKILSQNVQVNYVPSAYTTAGSVPAGTLVKSYLVHYDPVTTSVVSASGSMTFDGVILGLITSDARLDASDPIAGVAGVAYENGSRGLETAGSYVDLWSVNGANLTFNFTPFYTSTGMDEVRVLVAVPDGGATVLLLGSALLVLFGIGRKRLR